MSVAPPDDLAIAEARALAARNQLKATVEALQQRTRPAVLAQNGINTAQRYPGQIAGATALMIAFLARGKLAQAARKLLQRSKKKQPVVMDVQTTPIAPIKRITE